MKAPIFCTPSGSICGAMSTSTRAVASTRSSPTATRLVPPPMEAPTSTDRAPFSAFSRLEILDHDVLTVDAVRRPVGIAMAARVEGDGVIAGAAERFAGALPGVAGLSAAVLQ